MNQATGRHRLGRELRRLRLERSLRLEDVAAKLDLTPSSLSRIETGLAPVKTIYLHTMLELYGVDDAGQRGQLNDLARDGQGKDWWANWRDLLPAGAGRYLSLEAAAARVRSYSALALPGLVQTPAYTAAACRATWPSLTIRQVSALKELQLRRQELILHGNAPQVHLLIDEAALRRLVGAAAVMAAQLEHLQAVTATPALTVQVIRLHRAQSVLSPPFTLLGLLGQSDHDVVCSGGLGGQVIFAKRDTDLAIIERVLTALTRTALSEDASTKLIAEIAEHWKHGDTEQQNGSI